MDSAVNGEFVRWGFRSLPFCFGTRRRMRVSPQRAGSVEYGEMDLENRRHACFARLRHQASGIPRHGRVCRGTVAYAAARLRILRHGQADMFYWSALI
jgi:hypothetical protein